MTVVESLYRYPVKGLSPEPLAQVTLQAGKAFPGDRAIAVTNGRWTFDPTATVAHPKTDFYVLLLHERLAQLATRYDDATRTVTIAQDGRDVIAARVDDAAASARLAHWLRDFIGETGTPEVVVAPPWLRFTDVAVVSVPLMHSWSVINLASVRALEDWIGVPVDPMRFRANIVIDTGRAWEEFEWIDRDVAFGDIRTHGVLRTQRCLATHVDPATGDRDLDISGAIRQAFGHPDMGIYVEGRSDGTLTRGDSVRLI
ncbi:MAG: MOSC domain-containing protein [Burkholderiales bacterium]|nr:MOSC domain-containing protein [Burkholderiales bacterium]